MNIFANLIVAFIAFSLVCLTTAVIYEGAVAVTQTVSFARQISTAEEILVTAPALPPALEMPIEMPVAIPDIPDAELLETRPNPVLTSSAPVPNCPETEAVEDSPEDIPNAIELPDFHSMTVRALREYCKINSITGYSKYARCGKQVLADWLEIQTLGAIGRADTETLRDRYPEGSEIWNALNDIAQTL